MPRVRKPALAASEADARPWEHEPDRSDWRDEATGLPCIANRSRVGAWCGYVGIPPGHPLHGCQYNQCPQGCPAEPFDPESLPEPLATMARPLAKIVNEHPSSWCEHTPEATLEVHGGITYSAPCNRAIGICHVAAPGEPEPVWWFGFDCAHAWDLCPVVDGLVTRVRNIPTGTFVLSLPPYWGPLGTYRDLPYVRGECARLAAQLSS